MKEHRLPKEFTEKWTAALRSGSYKQTESQLYDGDNGFCCLGVACVVAGHLKNKLTGYGFPADVFQRLKIPKSLHTDEEDLAHLLSTMNDAGKSFEQIADWIDKNVELY